MSNHLKTGKERKKTKRIRMKHTATAVFILKHTMKRIKCVRYINAIEQQTVDDEKNKKLN